MSAGFITMIFSFNFLKQTSWFIESDDKEIKLCIFNHELQKLEGNESKTPNFTAGFFWKSQRVLLLI